MRIGTSITMTVAAAVAAAGVSCTSSLDEDWRRIDELDTRLGRVAPLDGIDGRMPRPEADPTAAGAAGAEAGLDRVESLLDRLRTGEPRTLDLATVRQSTLENNLAIQSALIGPEVGSQRLRAERAKFESTFTASVTQRRITNPDFFGAGYVDVETDEFTVAPGVEVPLRSGGRVTLDWTVGSESSQTSIADDTSIATSQPTVRLSQPLLREGGVEYNEASIAIAGAALGMDRATAQVAVINRIVQAEVAYWQLHLAWKILRIDLELYKTSRSLLDAQRTLVTAGASSIANVYNFEVNVAVAVDRVIESERALREAVRAVKVVMQDPTISLDGSVALEPTTPPTLVGYEFDTERLIEHAFANRAELLRLEYERLSRTAEVLMRENELLPEVDLMAAWSPIGFTTQTTSTSVPDANRNLFRGDTPPGWALGVIASVPLGNEVAIANHQAAILERLRTIADRRQQEILVTREVLDAVDRLEAGWDSIVTSQFRVQAADRYYRAYEALFNRGQIPSANLTQALQALNAARIQQATAEVEYQIAMAHLAQASGCLLGHASVDWTDDLDLSRLETPAASPSVTPGSEGDDDA